MFDVLYTCSGRPSIPTRTVVAVPLVLKAIYGLPSERLLLEQLNDNLVYRWLWVLAQTIPSGIRPASLRTGNDY